MDLLWETVKSFLLPFIFHAVEARVPNKDDLRLKKRLDLLQHAFVFHRQEDESLELVITEDFNRWDSLWGGNSLASHPRQEEGQLLIDLMSDLDLHLLLPRGTMTYTGVR